MSKTALVLGGSGFIAYHLIERLKREGYWIRAIDIRHPIYPTAADHFVRVDLRDPILCRRFFTFGPGAGQSFDEVYQLAADMGGAGYIFSGEHDADVMRNSATINVNVVQAARVLGCGKLFYSSSACVYADLPVGRFHDAHFEHDSCRESDAYPAQPDSEYGWEKLFSERLYMAHARNGGMNVRIARLHNVFGTHGAWRGGREKAPAAICRKVAEAESGGHIEIWGDGQQQRSFLDVHECIEGIRRLMASNCPTVVNLGSSQMVTINDLVHMVREISGKQLAVVNAPGPVGVRGRNSDNTLIREFLGWAPQEHLRDGLQVLYAWISGFVEQERLDKARGVA